MAVLAAFAAGSAAAQEQQPVDMLGVFDRFAASDAAARRCYKPSDEMLAKFLANYEAIMIRTDMTLRERNPALTEAAAQQAVILRAQQIDAAVASIVDTQTCTGKNVTDLIKLFEFHADWNMFQPPD